MVPFEATAISPEKIRRTIGTITGEENRRSILFFAGIHGNEPAGIIALEIVLEYIDANKIPFKGNLWALQGNLPALKEGKRYMDRDLNRIWFTRYNDLEVRQNGVSEIAQREELKSEIQDILDEMSGEVYFFDLHTTSSHSIPFISISDTMRNRQVIEKVPVPLVLGLEEQMEGTLFSYFSELGVSMALFEAGQHDARSSIDNHEAFIWLMLVHLGFVDEESIPDFHIYSEVLAKGSIFKKSIYELKYSYPLKDRESFNMNPGYVNFQLVKKNEVLAEDNTGIIRAPMKGRIFMPLYQKQGSEGFFIIKEIRGFWLRISENFRKFEVDSWMTLLPGVRKDKNLPECYLINRHIARFFVLDFFHLLGYRKVIRKDNRFIVKRRPFDLKQPPIDVVKERFIQIARNGSNN